MSARGPRSPEALCPGGVSPSASERGCSCPTSPGAPPPLTLTRPGRDMKAQDRLGRRCPPSGPDSSQRGCAAMCSASLLPPQCPGPGSPKALALHPSIRCCLCGAPGGLLLSTACALTPRFMAFEAEEQMQVQKLQLKKGAQTQPPPAPPRPDPRGPPAPVVDAQPGTPARSQGSPWPKATGPSAGHCPPHIGLILRGLWSFKGNSPESRSSAALCPHGVWTGSTLSSPRPAPCQGPA